MSESDTPHAPVRDDRPAVIVAPATHYLYLELECPIQPAAIRAEIWPAIRAVRARLQAARITPLGPSIAVYIESDRRHVVVRAGFVIAPQDAHAADKHVLAGVTPAIEVVHIVHTGPYEKLADGYDRLNEYLARIGRRMRAPRWEIYRDDQMTTPSKQLRTEICVSVAPLG